MSLFIFRGTSIELKVLIGLFRYPVEITNVILSSQN
jgi:hypothetical protein